MSKSKADENDDGVFNLLSELCHKTASKYNSQSKITNKQLITKMRSQAYELLLKKSCIENPTSETEPITDLLSLWFVAQDNCRNIADYKRCVDLKKTISHIQHVDFGENKEDIYNVLKLLVRLSNSVKEDVSTELFKHPFTFGLLDEMLPKPAKAPFGSPQPYTYYPSHVFELPYSLGKQGIVSDVNKSPTYSEYTVESFDSKSLLVDNSLLLKGAVEIKTFLSPMSLASLSSSHLSPYSDTKFCYKRLTAPRDLQIPPSDCAASNVKVSFKESSLKNEIKEVFNAHEVDIWEIASQIDKDIPDNIWEIACKLPPIQERQLIASSSREVNLWRVTYAGSLLELNIISEKQFIRHLMYLIIGIQTDSFPFNEELNCFCMKDGLVLEGISKEHLKGYVTSLLVVGTYYRRLYKFAFNQTSDDYFHSRGLVHEAAREVVRRYLLDFRLIATDICEGCIKNWSSDVNCMPTLLQILHHIESLKYEIETVAVIYKMDGAGPESSIPHGAELMSYLFNEISLVTHAKTASIMFNSLFSLCKVYFKFIERFIFEGELDDRYNEFFIRKDNQYFNCRTKRYWDRGYHITQTVAVPDFLKVIAKYILLCGKSLRLLKLCNPSDPLVLLISSDHPSVKCCGSFQELERQQRVLDVYRTRCLFVSGEPVTFDQILLKKEAAKKAFTEMASLKQAETLENILAERKRLAQLIIAEKQHSLRVLEAAMEEAKAAKKKAWERERLRGQLEQAADKAATAVDSIMRDDERNKIMEYYSKLNIEVERSKIHSEWKIKRLQLDQTRTQLLSTEERNLKREKLELEHKRNEEMMAMSIQSLDNDVEDKSENDDNEVNINNLAKVDNFEESSEKNIKSESQSSSVVLTAICNAAKSIFSWNYDDKDCDNVNKFDSQGNIVDSEVNRNNEKQITGKITEKLDNINDLEDYLKTRKEAVLNKQKVMAHEKGQVDHENNRTTLKTSITSIDNENNILTPSEEAKRNRIKVLGNEFDIVVPDTKVITPIPRTEAQKEALLNKQKVLGVEYNVPIKHVIIKEPVNEAQVEAYCNKKKVLSSEYDIHKANEGYKREKAKRSNLTLDLKSIETRNEFESFTSMTTYTITPNTGAITPAEFLPRLDLETPTTEIGPLTSNIELYTSQSESKTSEMGKAKSENQYLTSEGFNFSMIVDEDTTDADVVAVSDIRVINTPERSLSKTGDFCLNELVEKHSFINFIDGTYSLDDFDPFGTRNLKKYAKDHFSSQMDFEMKKSCYTHPAIIMEEVKKSPYNNMFARHNDTEEENKKINCDNIATLTACLQRSVLLPLTYQLEVVNNAILTYFLVNLDMYEYMRSLKDYFFLMDGEFSRSICLNLFTKLGQTLNPQELLNFATLHNILDKALGSSISHVHKFSENLSFTITESPLSFQHSSPDVLQCLSLTYSVTWPLNIILSQEALLRYAKVFQFLVKMRRVTWVLGEDFEALKLTVKLSRQHRRKFLCSPQYISVQIYRHIMASMLRALDNYIVTTCILSSWTEFESDLKKARTLDDLYDCHVVYIKKILFRCLLNNRSTPVMKLLNDIFTVILKFSRVLKAGEWKQKDTNGNFFHTNFAQLEELYYLFEKLNKYLHKVVTKLMECGYQRHLVELLTMVNLNGYYEPDKSKEEQNTSVQ